MTNYEKIKELLKEYNQEHLLFNYEKMTEENKLKLINQILKIDFEQINKLYKKANKVEIKTDDNIEPISYIDKSKLEDKEIQRYIEKGIEEIRIRKLAVVTMAGGQRNKTSDIPDQRERIFYSQNIINQFLRFYVKH